VTRRALLGYNGCVSGTNTPDCRAYPEKVRRRVNQSARTICSGRDFHECVALPLWASLRDTAAPKMPPAVAMVTTPAVAMVNTPARSSAIVLPTRAAATANPAVPGWIDGIARLR
jgi:hypothetical protein